MRNAIQFMTFAGFAALVSSAPAMAQPADLIAKAKAEGSVMLYSIAPTPVLQELAQKFNDKYGVKLEVFRAGGVQIEQKLSLEIRTNRVVADVVETADQAGINQLAAKGHIGLYNPANAAGLPAALADPKGRWMSYTQHLFPIIYNKSKLTAEQAPKSYKELADPAWKGKLSLASPNYGSTQMIFLKGILELGGWDLVKAYKANDAMVSRGWPDAENVIASGELLVGPDISIRTVAAIKQGAPLGFVFPADGTIAVQTVATIMKAAPHPNAARLLIEYLLSDDYQKLQPAYGGYPVRAIGGAPEGLPDLSTMKLHYVNVDELESGRADILARWTEMMERN